MSHHGIPHGATFSDVRGWHFAADCHPSRSCDATRMGSRPDPLRALGLDRASLDAAWNDAVARLRAKHGAEEADAMLVQAASNLSYWRANPAPWPSPDDLAAVVTGRMDDP